MTESGTPRAAIVDCGMGNLYSVRRACEQAGLAAEITADRRAILTADAVLLPGVGAFGDAMEALRRADLVRPLQDLAASPTPLVGICLGMQLLMSESHEFGHHPGLGVIPGSVVRLPDTTTSGKRWKVPHVGWNRVHPRANGSTDSGADPWEGSLLDGFPPGDRQYFVHSYHVVPEDPAVILAWTPRGDGWFGSALRRGAVTAFQFHPERSGIAGLRIYRNLADQLSAGAGRREVRRA